MFAALFVWLKVGISADSLVFGKYKVDGLYIKLDKKLTLKAQKVIIPKSKSKPSFNNVDHTFDKIKHLFTFFNYIDLKNITFEDNHINLLFTDDILYVTSDDYEIAGNIHREDQKLVAEVSMLYIKKENIYIKGTLTYDLDSDVLATEGDFSAYNIKGKFFAVKEKDRIDFKVQSDRFTDLETLIDTFKLKEGVKSWITQRVQAKSYKLHALTGQGNITKDGFKINFDLLKGEMLFDDVKIFYQKELDPILAKNFTLTYKNSALYFDLKKPHYKNIDLNGSTIAIEGLGSSSALLKLDLKMHTHIDNEVQKILKSYALNIPVKHKGKKSDLFVKMGIPLGESAKKKKSSIQVAVDVANGLVWYNKIKLPVSKAKVSFDNRKKESMVVDAVLKKGTVDIGKTKLPVLGGKAKYSKGIVTLHNVHIKEKWYEGKANGTINLVKKNVKLKFNAKQVSIGDTKKFLVLKNKTLPMHINYSKDLSIDLTSLGVKIDSKKSVMQIKVKDISKIKPYLRHIDVEFEGGNLDVTKKGLLYTFIGNLHRKSCFFYEKNGVCHTKVPISGKLDNGKLDFYAFGKRMHYSSKKSRIKLNKINVDLKKLLETRTKKKTTKAEEMKRKKLVILGKNSKLRYGKYTLLTDSYDIEISPNGNIKAYGSLDGDIVKFTKSGKNISIKALRVKDKMLHPLIKFKGLKRGRYSLKKSGNPDKVMKGQIIVEGGVMSDFKVYNNTLAFINAVPALATLSSPGFSEKGFKIKEGVVEYRMIGDKIIFDSVYIKGSSATIVGKGMLNLKKNTIDMKLAIQTARELGKFVGNLPLLGYIIMGKDKSMTVGLTITGKLNAPQVRTSAAQDILSLPLQIIKRTLESPAHIINK